MGSSPGQVKPKTIKLVFVASPLSMQHKEKEQTVWHGIRIMCPSEAICLPVDYCFSQLPLQKSNSTHFQIEKD